MKLREELFTSELATERIKRMSVRGGTATLASRGSVFVLNLLAILALARLLTPQDFGLVAMVAVVVNFAVLFKDIGLSAATVRADRITHEQASFLFWVNVGGSFAVVLLIAAASPLVSLFYGEDQLTLLTLGFTLPIILSGFMVQHEALLRRHMRFFRIGAVQVSATALSAVVAVACAWHGMGFWALVVQRIAHALFSTTGTWLACPWLPGAPRRGAGVRNMLVFGGHLTAQRLLQYLLRNADNLLIGRYCGGQALGYYSKAYSLLLMPLRQINVPLDAVTLPALSRYQDDPAAFRHYYRRALVMMTSISMPTAAFAAAAAPEIIRTILGPQWEDSIRLFLLLAPAAFMGTFNVSLSWVYLALGRADRQLRAAVVLGVLGLTGMSIGLQWGPEGVATAVSVLTVVLRYPHIVYCFRGTHLRPVDLWHAIRVPALSSLGAAATLVLATGAFCRAGLVPPALLAIKAVCYALLYFGLFAMLPGGRRELQSFRRALSDAWPRLRTQTDVRTHPQNG